MQDQVKQLFKLQDLEIVVDESRILHRQKPEDDRPGNLNARINELRSGVGQGLLKRYDSLRQRGLAVAEEHDGICHGCRLNVPVGDLNRMRKGALDWVCPNCARFLLLSDKK